MRKLHQKVKKLDFWDIQLVKLAVVAFTLFVLKIWPAAMDFVHKVDWKWFLGIGIIFALRPFVRSCCKK